jgi:hypothetical protein
VIFLIQNLIFFDFLKKLENICKKPGVNSKKSGGKSCSNLNCLIHLNLNFININGHQILIFLNSQNVRNKYDKKK